MSWTGHFREDPDWDKGANVLVLSRYHPMCDHGRHTDDEECAECEKHEHFWAPGDNGHDIPTRMTCDCGLVLRCEVEL